MDAPETADARASRAAAEPTKSAAAEAEIETHNASVLAWFEWGDQG